MSRLPPLTSLRAFVVTARHLNFGKAAEELHVTAAAIGQQVRILEDHLGKLLFQRNRGELALTPAGVTLYPGLRDAFEAVVDTVGRLIAVEQDAPIRVTVAPSFASKWLIPRLDALREAVPLLEVVVDASAQLTDFSNNDADCAIRYGSGAYPGLVSERLFPEAVAPVCSPEYALRHNLYHGFPVLQNAFILHEDGPEQDPSCPGWEDWLKSQGYAAKLGGPGIRLSQSSLVLDAALAGKGVGLGKLTLAAADLEAGRLVVPFGQPQPVDFSYYFVAPPQKAKLPSVEAFRSWLLAEAARFRALDKAFGKIPKPGLSVVPLEHSPARASF